MGINDNTTKPIFIEIYFNNIKLGTATGFEVQHGYKYLVTNWHVVSGRHFITKKCLDEQGAIPNKLIVKYKKYIDDEKFEWTEKSINLYDEENNKLWYEHPKYNSAVDVVLIILEKHPKYQHYKECFNINTSYNLDVTENVFVLGFPFGYTVKSKNEPHAVWTSGTVASEPSLNLNINNKEVPAFLIDSKTRQGQSGSPVIYYSKPGIDHHIRDGGFGIWGTPFMKEVGIYSGRINEDSDLGYVWKWFVIKDIIDSIKQ